MLHSQQREYTNYARDEQVAGGRIVAGKNSKKKLAVRGGRQRQRAGGGRTNRVTPKRSSHKDHELVREGRIVAHKEPIQKDDELVVAGERIVAGKHQKRSSQFVVVAKDDKLVTEGGVLMMMGRRECTYGRPPAARTNAFTHTQKCHNNRPGRTNRRTRKREAHTKDDELVTEGGMLMMMGRPPAQKCNNNRTDDRSRRARGGRTNRRTRKREAHTKDDELVAEG